MQRPRRLYVAQQHLVQEAESRAVVLIVIFKVVSLKHRCVLGDELGSVAFELHFDSRSLEDTLRETSLGAARGWHSVKHAPILAALQCNHTKSAVEAMYLLCSVVRAERQT